MLTTETAIRLWKIRGDQSEKILDFVASSEEAFTCGLIEYRGDHYGFFRYDDDGVAHFMLTGGIMKADFYLREKVDKPHVVRTISSPRDSTTMIAVWSDGIETSIDFRNWKQAPTVDELIRVFTDRRFSAASNG